MRLSTGFRVQGFRDAVRNRDRRCVITGAEVIAIAEDNWTGFQASHIFPLAYEGEWTRGGFSRWITIVTAVGGSINSIQNGMLLRNDIHSQFDQYDFAINPDVCIPSFLKSYNN